MVQTDFGKYAARVPTEYVENLRFRRALLLAARNNRAAQQRLRECCKLDPLFFLNAFCWLYEPRPRVVAGKLQPEQFPMIAWDHQTPVIQGIYEHLGLDDIGLEKSRGEGASWIGVLLAVHSWLFYDMRAIGFVSKDENSADNPEDPDSLMWKCDWELQKLPDWMSGFLNKDYKRDRNRHVLKNLRNGSSITAYAATGNVATGGRKTWFLMDELAKFPRPQDKDAMASTQHVTNCRFCVSTPFGSEGAYYDMMHSPSNMIRLKLRWQDNPAKNRGLYRLENNRPVAVDPVNNPLPPEDAPPSQEVLERWERLRRKGFRLERRDRSPWYDRECDRIGATPQNIAQELDIDYGGSSFRIFGTDILSKVEDSVKAPLHEGDIDFDTETLKPTFDEVDNGPFKLWLPLDQFRRPPPHSYVVGCDVSAGLGGSHSSNSTIIAIDMTLGEQVVEMASNSIPPADFADLAIATCIWLNGAFLVWETNGPGQAFTLRSNDRRYHNIYYRVSMSRRKKGKRTEPGWHTSDVTKEMMMDNLRGSIRSGELVIRSRRLKEEMAQYIRRDGKIHNALSINATDDSRGASHGDRVIGLGVAQMARLERPTSFSSIEEADVRKVPRGSMAERDEEYRRSLTKRRDDSYWDDRSIATMCQRD